MTIHLLAMTILNEAWVLWKLPDRIIPERISVLSFLSPSIEEGLREKIGSRLVAGRLLCNAVRPDAVTLYKELIAHIGIAPCFPKGNTFLQKLTTGHTVSAWWYHPVAFRDPEADPTLNQIIQIQAIRYFLDQHPIDKIVCYGPDRDVIGVLARSLPYFVENRKPLPRTRLIGILRKVASRLIYGVRFIVQRISLYRHRYKLPHKEIFIALAGFWDWSFWHDQKKNCIEDRYFKKLPEALRHKLGKSQGYFAWLDTTTGSKRKRSLARVLEPVKHYDRIVVLQAFLGPLEVLRYLLNVKPLFIYWKVRKRKSFRSTFVMQEVDWFPLLDQKLLEGFTGTALPHCCIVSLASERAFRRYQPKVLLTFLEHFPFSRAQYAAAKKMKCKIECWAVQHASYNHDKTLYYLHPKAEVSQNLSGTGVPMPDGILVMGKLARKLFLECGYAEENVIVTGSPRYDNLSINNSKNGIKQQVVSSSDRIVILFAAGLDKKVESDALDALCQATKDLEGIEIRLRNHPFARLDLEKSFIKWREHVKISNASLEQDLSQCCLLYFSYSTVAEQAYVQGKAVCQWIPAGYNASALAEVETIPQFGTVLDLKRFLMEFREAPHKFRPTNNKILQIRDQLFEPADNDVACRITDWCQSRFFSNTSNNNYIK